MLGKKISTKGKKRGNRCLNYCSEYFCIGDGRVQTTHIQIILQDNAWNQNVKNCLLAYIYIIIFRLLRIELSKSKRYMEINFRFFF